jgi:MFS family permease
MDKRQLLALFLCGLIPWTVGNGLLPLLPICATELGADPFLAGFYLSFSYLALAAGTIAAGWLADRFQRRKLPLILAGAICVPTLWLMGRAATFWQLTALTALNWFFGGMGLALISILTGLFTDERDRGRIFGILSLSGGFGTLIGGLSTGPIVDRWGYGTMFSTLAVFTIIWPFVGLLLKDKDLGEQKTASLPGGSQEALGRNVKILLAAGLAASVANFIGMLCRSLMMDNQGYHAAAVSSTAAISGGITLPLVPLIGWLSDKSGRKLFMVLSYVVGMVSMVVMVFSSTLWHFWGVSILLTMFISVNGNIGSALMADLVPVKSLGRGMSLFNATTWVGGVIGFSGAGYLIQGFGIPVALFIGTGFILVAFILLMLIRSPELGEER